MDRIGKYEDLNKKYMELESRSMGIAKEESKRRGFEDVEAELAVKKNEIKGLKDPTASKGYVKWRLSCFSHALCRSQISPSYRKAYYEKKGKQ